MSRGDRGSTRLVNLWEETMKTADKWRMGMRPLLLLAMLLALFASSCRNNEVEVPPLTGPSGHRLFITIEAKPDHLVIHAPGRPRESSQITIQLKNQQGTGVAGENIKLRILNLEFVEFNIGRLSDYNVTTDSAGFARVIYTAPDQAEQLVATQVYIKAILTNPAFVDEVTDQHKLDLETSAVVPGDCVPTANPPVAAFTINPNPGTTNADVCFDGTTSSGGIVAAAWDFGDGSRASGLFVCHRYSSIGQFPVTLTIQDVNHHCATLTQSVTIDTGEPATCSIVTSPAQIEVDQTVFFTALTQDPDGRVRRFSWNFGDGSATTTSRNTTSHRYRTAGSFSVILTITDDQGNQSFCQTSISVQAPGANCPPITLAPATLPDGTVAVAYNQVVTQLGGVNPTTLVQTGTLPTGLTFADNGNGTGTISGNPTAAGAFNFTITVTDVNGCTGSQAYTVTIAP